MWTTVFGRVTEARFWGALSESLVGKFLNNCLDVGELAKKDYKSLRSLRKERDASAGNQSVLRARNAKALRGLAEPILRIPFDGA
jgi:hypothetical protein